MRGSRTGSDDPTDAATARMVGIVALAGVVLLAVAGAVVLGPVPLLDDRGADSGTPANSTPDGVGDGAADGGGGAAGAGSDGGAGDGGDGSGTDPDHVRPFTLTIDEVTECGRTCRDVTASLTNNGGNPRANVVVETDVLAGDDVVWEGSQAIGTLDPGETATHTERVELGLLDAAKIEGNDGYVTVVTTVTWDDGSATYRERMQVA